MTSGIEWIDDRQLADGVTERSFRLVGKANTVPGVLWLPPSATSPPRLVLLGHGGGGHKKGERIVPHARWFASRAGLAAAAIDGPYHGDRAPQGLVPGEYQALIAEEGIDVVLDRMTADWQETIDALGASGLVDVEQLGYLGTSMGSRYGLPLVAALGDRFRAVVFGKFGLRQGPALHAGMAGPERIERDARRVTAPALVHVQWDDEIFPRDGQLALFDVLGSRDKRLIGNTGGHGETDPAAVALWRAFIAHRLTSDLAGQTGSRPI